MLLDGRTALITGASRGIGAAIMKAFAREGAHIVASGRTAELEDTARELREKGCRVTVALGDLRDDAFVRGLVQTCKKELGRLDVLVNNAGILIPGILGMTPLQTIRDLLEVNVVALINLTQYAIRIMDSTRHPSIIHMASVAGTNGLEGLSAYAASKGAVVGFARASAKELAGRGIRVNAIAPGFIDTDMLRGLSDEESRKRLDSIRAGRFGTPEEVAGVAVFLASDLSRYVTGQVLAVEGSLAT